jgi:hypothetical protein
MMGDNATHVRSTVEHHHLLIVKEVPDVLVARLRQVRCVVKDRCASAES